MTPDSVLLQSFARLLEDKCPDAQVAKADGGAWPAALWHEVENFGLPLALVPEAQGGFGLTMEEALGAVRLAGRHALPLPLPETMVANWLLGLAGLAPFEGPATVACGAGLVREGAVLTGTADRVPWGRSAAVVAVVEHGGAAFVHRVGREGVSCSPGANIAHEPRDRLRFDAHAAPAAPLPAGIDGAAVLAVLAACRCSQMAGAIGRVGELAVAYVLQREQFGRKLAAFQAIQQSLAVLTGQAAAARAAAELAAEAAGEWPVRTLAIAAAKARIGEAAGIVAAIAHQVHGAMGASFEYPLHLLTRRLWSWRDEYGNEASWAAELGRSLARDAARIGQGGLWSALTGIQAGGMRDKAASPAASNSADALRGEVRAFLATELASRTPAERAQSWNGHDAGFSRKLGARGWLGMTWPREYGGQERSALERYVVIEELLAAGAPVSAHWIAERQSGPTLLRYGTPEQRRDILPRIARGECYFCIGMSEAGSGSDLASARTRATAVDGGYRVNGTKLWTTNAHHSHYMILYCKTGTASDDRRGGASQFLVNLTLPGIQIRPVLLLTGEHHFNEVHFDDVFLPASALIGQEGQGWSQVAGELAFERSGPDRFLSSFAALEGFAARIGPDPAPHQATALGRMAAHVVVLRRMSQAVAATLERDEDPSLQAAIVKDLGAVLEQEMPEIVRQQLALEPGEGGGDLEAVLDYLIQHAPTFSLRGGTREILRGIIARGAGLR